MKLTDYQINLKVAMLDLDFEDLQQEPNGSEHSAVAYGDGYNWYSYDPCNEWSDIGPIIERYGISLQFDGDWIASNGKKQIRDANPKKAAVIVFLMSLEVIK